MIDNLIDRMIDETETEISDSQIAFPGKHIEKQKKLRMKDIFPI